MKKQLFRPMAAMGLLKIIKLRSMITLFFAFFLSFHSFAWFEACVTNNGNTHYVEDGTLGCDYLYDNLIGGATAVCIDHISECCIGIWNDEGDPDEVPPFANTSVRGVLYMLGEMGNAGETTPPKLCSDFAAALTASTASYNQVATLYKSDIDGVIYDGNASYYMYHPLAQGHAHDGYEKIQQAYNHIKAGLWSSKAGECVLLIQQATKDLIAALLAMEQLSKGQPEKVNIHKLSGQELKEALSGINSSKSIDTTSSKVDGAGVEVYPNPANEGEAVRIIGVDAVTITDINGKQYGSYKVKNGKLKGKLSPGVYFIDFGNGEPARKLIIK